MASAARLRGELGSEGCRMPRESRFSLLFSALPVSSTLVPASRCPVRSSGLWNQPHRLGMGTGCKHRVQLAAGAVQADPCRRRGCRQPEPGGFYLHSIKPPCRRAWAAHSFRRRAGAAPRLAEARRRGEGWGRGFHTRTLFPPSPATAPPSPAATRGFICLQADYVSSSLSSRSMGPPPGPFFPPPPAPNLLASQWCDLRNGWSRPSRSRHATSFPRRYKK